MKIKCADIHEVLTLCPAGAYWQVAVGFSTGHERDTENHRHALHRPGSEGDDMFVQKTFRACIDGPRRPVGFKVILRLDLGHFSFDW